MTKTGPMTKSAATTKSGPDFDLIARPYRWMEYATFGPLLERARFCRIPELETVRRALVMGDGDGRFVARFLKENPEVLVDVVDLSPKMLGLLEARVRKLGPEAHSRIAILRADIRDFSPPETAPATGYDLVVTHFFLDCLTPFDLEGLLSRLGPHLAPGARWLVSEFQIPESGFAAGMSRLVVSGLYQAFRLLTGLEVRELPAWERLLERFGFSRCEQRTWLGGLLTSEIWKRKATDTGFEDS